MMQNMTSIVHEHESLEDFPWMSFIYLSCSVLFSGGSRQKGIIMGPYIMIL